MPELPEVQTVVSTLEHLIKDAKIKDIKIYYDKIIVGDSEYFKQICMNQSFRNFTRRGKYIVLNMDNIDLVVHLRMEGKFYVQQASDVMAKHTHLSFYLEDGRRLDYHDTRKFGRIELMPSQESYEHFKTLGPEPWSERFNEQYIKEYFAGKSTSLKVMLLNQEFVAGIGNIYADEVCFALKLHPLTPISKLKKKDFTRLIEAVRSVLEKAIAAGGSTIRSYTSSLGVSGLFQLQINVYGQVNKPCPVCSTPIKKIKVAQRGTSYCPKCQRLKK